MTDSSVQIKPIRSRQLRSGAWVIVANGSEPLVVSSEEVVRILSSGVIPMDSDFADLRKIMLEGGFFVKERDRMTGYLPSPPNTPVWIIARWLLLIIGLIMSAIALVLLAKSGIPTGADIVSTEAHPIIILVLVILIAMVTSVPHELAHVLFGKTFRQRYGSVRLNPRRAVATTSLTHVWVWPLSPRLAAISAGVVVDLCFLVIVLVAREVTGVWVATVGVAVLLMRIVWQLRFHRNCDGRYIVKMLIDNPMIEMNNIKTPSAWLWISLVIFGIIAELSLLVVWVGPAILRIASVI